MRQYRAVLALVLGALILFGTTATPSESYSDSSLGEKAQAPAMAWLQPSPYQGDQWFQVKSNLSNGQDEFIRFVISPSTNATWWHMEMWNETTESLNQTFYVKRISGEGGHEHVYAVEGYSVITLGMQGLAYQWDGWFDLEGVGPGSQIGPIDFEGDSMTLTVNTTELVTTPAGTFECWVANESKLFYDVNYWIDKDSNLTIQSVIDVAPAIGGGRYMAQLNAASWLIPPVITNPQADPLRFSCTITWDTDEPADSKVRYGIATDNLNMSVQSSILDQFHSVTLDSLLPLTTYYYDITSADAWGNPTVDNNTGAYYSFSTLSAVTPEITSLMATPLSNTTVRLSFDTDKATNMTVWYAEEEPLTNIVSDSAFVIHHEIDIAGLSEFTEYQYIVGVSDSLGNRANSTLRNFVTLDLTPPGVTTMAITVSADTLNVTIEANEPFWCELYVGNDTDTMTLRANETEVSGTHAALASGLPSYTTVFFRLRLVDVSGNDLNHINGSVPFKILIPDYLLPEIDHPDDIFIPVQVLPEITWQASDQTPQSYEILFDGASVEDGDWDGGAIVYEPSSSFLSQPGVYVVELVLKDRYGNVASDTVIITVSGDGPPPAIPLPSPVELAIVGSLAVIILAVIVIIRRR